jgi:uncharacterized CHY-type Zn-finger protein
MSIMCKTHPKYKAVQKPRSSTNFPNGCPDCWDQYNDKQLKARARHSNIHALLAYCGVCDKNVQIDSFEAYGEPQAGSVIYGDCPDCDNEIYTKFY